MKPGFAGGRKRELAREDKMMATAAENLLSAYESVSAKLADVLADPKPNYTVDGVTMDRIGYYRFLLDAQKLARAAMIAAAGPFNVVSVAR